MDLRSLADRRPLALAAASFLVGVAAILVSVPTLTVEMTQTSSDRATLALPAR